MKISWMILFIGILFTACESGEIVTMHPNGDETPPDIVLRVSFVDSNTGQNETVILTNHDSKQLEHLPVEIGTPVWVSATATDAQGVHALRLWSVGVDFVDMLESEYLNPDPSNAYQEVTRAGNFIATREHGHIVLFANAVNFGGGETSTTTREVGCIELIVNGPETPPIPAGALYHDVEMTYNPFTNYLTSDPSDKPVGAATIIGVKIQETPGGHGTWVSVSHAPTNPLVVDLRKDFHRFGMGSTAHFYDGRWTDGVWLGSSQLFPMSDYYEMTLRVFYLPEEYAQP